MERVHLRVEGHVQGVFFRANTRDEAKKLGLTGTVKNTSDGGVEIVAEGEKPVLTKFIEWCRNGPPGARVIDVSVSWNKYEGHFSDFRVVY